MGKGVLATETGSRGMMQMLFRMSCLLQLSFAALALRKEVPSPIPKPSGRHFSSCLVERETCCYRANDVTIISPMQLQILARTASGPGYAFRVGENYKLAAHLVAESMGGWSDDAISIIQRVGHMLGQRIGVSPHITNRQLFQKLSVTLCQGNAILFC